MRPRTAGVAAVALSVAALAAQEPVRPVRFAYERPIVTAGAGAQRLAVDVPLVAAGAPFTIVRRPDGLAAAGGLGDLRLFQGSGREVPYLLVHAPPSVPDWINGVVLPVAATEKASGFEADIGSAETVDAIRVEGLPAPFLKRLVLEGGGDRSHWTMLDPEGTLFDLPDEALRQLEIPFRPGAYRYLRVTWDDTNSGRLPMPRLASARRVAAPASPLVRMRALEAERRPSEPGRSRYRLRLPGPRLPVVALQIDVGGSGPLLRQAVIFESRLTGGEAAPATLGRATLRRAVRGGAAASALRVPIERPTEAEFDLLIEDGNNPPLDLERVSAVFAELPWIYFEAPDGSLVARYGDASAKAPSYDLEAVRDSVRINAVPEAKWGEPRPLVVDARAAPPPPEMPAIGAPVDPASFRFARPIPDGPAGLVALPLDAAALAHSGGPVTRFSDVRIIEPGGRQVPYLVERRDEPLSLDLALEPVTAEVSPSVRSGRNRTAYRVKLPYAGLPDASIVLETPAHVFQRTLQLGVERPPDRRHRDARYEVFAHRVWQHADQQTAAPALTLQVPSLDATELILTVDEGDNSALPIAAARLLLPSYRLRFYRPASALRVVYGRSDLGPPRYDLALLATQVLGAETREVAADPESGAGAAAARTLVSPRVFWALLSLVIVVLLAMIGRLVATSSAPPSR